jgi:hypothetical protein
MFIEGYSDLKFNGFLPINLIEKSGFYVKEKKVFPPIQT